MEGLGVGGRLKFHLYPFTVFENDFLATGTQRTEILSSDKDVYPFTKRPGRFFREAFLGSFFLRWDLQLRKLLPHLLLVQLPGPHTWVGEGPRGGCWRVEAIGPRSTSLIQPRPRNASRCAQTMAGNLMPTS